MTRYGTVLTFARGVTKDQALEALEKFVRDNPGLLAKETVSQNETCRELGIHHHYRLQKYDDRYGGPVWYIP